MPLRWRKPTLPGSFLSRRSRAAIIAKTATTAKGRKKRRYLLTGEASRRQDQRRLGREMDARRVAPLRQRPFAAADRQHDLLLRRALQEDVAQVPLEGHVQHDAFHRRVRRAGAEAEGLGPDKHDGGIARTQAL